MTKIKKHHNISCNIVKHLLEKITIENSQLDFWKDLTMRDRNQNPLPLPLGYGAKMVEGEGIRTPEPVEKVGYRPPRVWQASLPLQKPIIKKIAKIL